jgi:hypothetical protein
MEEQICITDHMRQGHPYLSDSVEVLFERIQAHVRRFDRAPVVFEIGCASGMLTERVARSFPDVELIAQEELPSFVAHARRRLAGLPVQLFTAPLGTFDRRVDIFYSAGTHHHMPEGYLADARRLLDRDGVYIVDDEFCPEYCLGDHADRIARAELFHLARGFLLTHQGEVAAFTRDGTIPTHAIELERLRKLALWRWYRFVVDHAVEQDSIEVASAELRSAADDLITGSEAEHKFSPAVVERQFELAGFRRLSKSMIGPADQPALQSFFVYEFAPV